MSRLWLALLLMLSKMEALSGDQLAQDLAKETNLRSCQPDMCATLKELATMQIKLAAAELKRQNADQTSVRVAFSVALKAFDGAWGAVGPYPEDTVMVYKGVFLNLGEAYSPSTGIFTAPVNGVYSFNFHIYGYSTTSMGVSLFKNEQRISTAYDHPSQDSTDTASNSALLSLDKGDKVSIRLWANHQVYMSSNNHNIFSGFLVFPL